MKNDGFTLLEALISLLIAALVLTSLQFFVPFLK
ncbi:prepilin-type N-terminal cleavage/methylation domain-containing protein [Leuconostoc mesenteroides]|nr:prepilin-type N-terminal cleavage/methylation domain-containing protein [Leuconostoc mesenteroides]